MYRKPHCTVRGSSARARWWAGLAAGIILLMLSGTLAACGTMTNAPTAEQTDTGQLSYAGKRIVFVQSYHQGYEWADGIEAGIRSVLDGSGVELKVIYLDTKRNPSTEFCMNAGTSAKAEIDAFKPDVVIAVDDNAQKCLVVPYLKDTGLPVVFAGVNWDASMYGYPARNMTGMIEVELPGQLIELLKPYAKGTRLAYITIDSETERKVADIYNELFFNGEMKVYWARTYDEFMQAFLDSQKEVDIVFMGNNAGADRWDEAEAAAFVKANIKVPTGSINSWMEAYSVITLAKRAEEQGEWSAQAALQILDGTPPSSIAVAKNKQGSVVVNLELAEALGIVLSPSVLKSAEVYQAPQK